MGRAREAFPGELTIQLRPGGLGEVNQVRGSERKSVPGRGAVCTERRRGSVRDRGQATVAEAQCGLLVGRGEEAGEGQGWRSKRPSFVGSRLCLYPERKGKQPNVVVGFVCLFEDFFIYLRGRESEDEAEGEEEGEADSPLSRDPDEGLDPRVLGS